MVFIKFCLCVIGLLPIKDPLTSKNPDEFGKADIIFALPTLNVIGLLPFRDPLTSKNLDEIEKENEALKKQNEKKAQEIKKLKQEAKQTPVPAPISEPIQPPAQPSPVTILTSPQTQNEDVIMVNRSEYILLKKRYGIAKTALEAVLCFIVGQNLRDLVNKAMKDISEADEF